MPNNVNVGRIVGGATVPVLDPGGLAVEHQRLGNPPTFQRGVVEEVIFNPKALTPADRDRLRGAVVNPEEVDQVAANSVVATLISDGISDATPARALLYPFFQSHIALPVQVGEQVTVVFEDFQRFGFRGGRWITRTSEGLPVEDPNFTHNDRRFQQENFGGLRVSSSLARTQQGVYVPGFPNGGGESNTTTLPQAGSTNPYDTLYQKTITGSVPHQYEPVPRWTKRPQEFILQGMNNTLVVLGQDRPGAFSGAEEQRSLAGSIDIVTGRGRYLLEPGTGPFVTSPLVLVNSRSLFETDKVPKLSNRQEQLQEGDPDYVRDAARLLVSMKTQGDLNFRLGSTREGAVNRVMTPSGINYSTTALAPPRQFPSSSNNVGTSYLVGKADHVRLVARRSDPQDRAANPISGSVLILKEGTKRTPDDMDAAAPPDDCMAYLYMSPEGRVQVDGLQIFLGGAALRVPNDQAPPPDRPRNPQGSTSELNVGDTNEFAGAEPYIKWSEFKRVVEGLQRQIDALQTAYTGLVEDLKTYGQLSVCSPGGPDSAWASMNPSITSKRERLRSSINQHRVATNRAVYRSRSAKIFGC